MKVKFGLFLGVALAVLTCIQTFAQEKEKNRTYRVWVKTIDEGRIRGYVHSVDNETFSVRRTLSDTTKLKTVSYDAVEKIKFRRRGALTKGLGIGVFLSSPFLLYGIGGYGHDNGQELLTYGGVQVLIAGVIGTLKTRFLTEEELASKESIKNKLRLYQKDFQTK